jgi:nitroreductase
MDVLSAIEQRRSIKHFDPEFKIPAAETLKLESLMRTSPTAFNIQNWRIVKVTDPKQREKIRECAWNQAQVTDASLFYILCGDLNAFEKDPRRYWVEAPEEVQSFMAENITAYYKDKPQVQRDEVMRSCGILAQTMMLAARGLGYESCPMDGFDFDAVSKLINLPKNFVIAMFVAIGKPVQPARPKGGFISNDEVFQIDSF